MNDIANRKSSPHYLMIFFLFLYFCGSYIFNVYAWGRYVYLFAIILMLCTSIALNNYKLKFFRGKYPTWLLSFSVICFASILWSWESSAAWARTQTVLVVSICSYLIYICVREELSLREIINVIMFSGYIEALYLFLSFGISDLLNGGTRLSSSLGNSNFLSFLMSVSLVLTADSIFNERVHVYHLMAVPSLYILAIGQSRTALIGAVFGFVVLLFLRALRSRYYLNVLLKLVFYIFLGCFFLFVLSQMDIFSGVFERMGNLIASYTGKGTITGGERSVTTRRYMIQIGMKYFFQHPLFGVGIGNSSVITQRELGWSTYLHNNFVEILSTLGIVGFFIYYSAFIVPAYCFFKYRKYKDKEYDVVFSLLLMLLLMDYGSVSYYTKDTFIYFMIFFVEADRLKHNYEETVLSNEL